MEMKERGDPATTSPRAFNKFRRKSRLSQHRVPWRNPPTLPDWIMLDSVRKINNIIGTNLLYVQNKMPRSWKRKNDQKHDACVRKKIKRIDELDNYTMKEQNYLSDENTNSLSPSLFDKDYCNTLISIDQESIHEDFNSPQTLISIDQESIHKICSGQVIFDLKGAVKELVENSIDAGAKQIEIVIKDFGFESFEVSDTGNGILCKDFPLLCRPHTTSKLKDFKGLTKVFSFGFRGEALSALCSLSKLSLTTRHYSSDTAFNLSFNHLGELISQDPTQRAQGTSVVLKNIFESLPVRRQEFQRNKKKEFSKLLQLLKTYVITGGGRGIRFRCIHHHDGRKEVFLHSILQGTKENSSGGPHRNLYSAWDTRDLHNTISSVWGATIAKFLQSVDFVLDDDNDTHLGEVRGFIGDPKPSAPVALYRKSNEWQIVLINGRPVDFPSMNKAVTTAFRQVVPTSKKKTFPVFVLNFFVPLINCDINITPDKRTVLLHHERAIINVIQRKCLQLWEPYSRTYCINQNETDKGSILCLQKMITKEKPLETTRESEFPGSFSSPLGSPQSKLTKQEHTIQNTGEHPNEKKEESSLQNIENTMSSIGKDIQPNKKKETFLVTNIGNIIQKLISFEEMKTVLHDLGEEQPEKTENEKYQFTSKLGVSPDSHSVNELSIVFQKEKFKKLITLGQFNLGFIIALLHNNLFIIDQHASDEIRNFEFLKTTVKFSKQDLFRPISLDISIEDELLILDHLEIFEKNGFEFLIDQSLKPQERIKLKTIPYYKKIQFGVDDIHGLIAKIKESDCFFKSLPLSEKAEKMYASKACRTSIMIGDHLDFKKMDSILNNLSTLSKPWNCPHGRPTMRYLYKMKGIFPSPTSKESHLKDAISKFLTKYHL